MNEYNEQGLFFLNYFQSEREEIRRSRSWWLYRVVGHFIQ